MPRVAELFGLVLAGGDSRRMGVDKGALEYHGSPHARYLWDLIGTHVERCLVSVSAAQQHRPPYSGLPLIIDAGVRRGPATGLLAAHNAYPDHAWLVVAVDLARLDAASVARLVEGRQPQAAATAMRHTDGTIEPLFAIWEPSSLALLARRFERGDASPRRCLEVAGTAILSCAEPEALRSVDSSRERDALIAGTPESLDQ
jgi:molybdopterin-guanine dinucleotide biosynthesis protein A